MPPHRMFAKLRKYFLSGLVLFAPIGITLFVFNWLLVKIGGSAKDQLFFFLPDHLIERDGLQMLWNIVATAVILLAITALGFLSRYFFARYLIRIGDRILNNVPVVNTVYTSVKQIVETFSVQNRSVFQKVVLIEFPKPGIFAIGFLTGTAKGEVQLKTEKNTVNIFVPTTPNPTSGFLVMVPEEDVMPLEMTVGQGMKLIISGGAVVPPYPPVVEALEIPAK